MIKIIAVAISPIIHSATSIGNTSILRTEELADGSKVPFVSGNSIKGRLRRATARACLEALHIGNTLSKAQVDFLFSGGHLSRGGGPIDLSKAREIERLLPFVSLFGYSAGNMMTESKIRCSHWHLLCEENRFRLHGEHEGVTRASKSIDAGFGTRRDVGTGNLARDFLDPTEIGNPDAETAQMIYEHQQVKSGAQFVGSIATTNLSDYERSALWVGLDAMAVDRIDGYPIWAIGGKNNVGYGLVKVDCHVSDEDGRHIEDEVIGYLQENRDEVLKVLSSCA